MPSAAPRGAAADPDVPLCRAPGCAALAHHLNMQAQTGTRTAAAAPSASRPRPQRAAQPCRRQWSQPPPPQRLATAVRAQTEQKGEQKGDTDKRAGRSTYRPTTYTELVDDAVAAVAVAVEDGLNRLEVEFPAVSNVDGKWRRRRQAQLGPSLRFAWLEWHMRAPQPRSPRLWACDPPACAALPFLQLNPYMEGSVSAANSGLFAITRELGGFAGLATPLPSLAGTSSFAFQGTNAHALISPAADNGTSTVGILTPIWKRQYVNVVPPAHVQVCQCLAFSPSVLLNRVNCC